MWYKPTGNRSIIPRLKVISKFTALFVIKCNRIYSSQYAGKSFVRARVSLCHI